MAPINGRPFLEHQMSYWIKQGVDHFVLSVGYRHEVIMRHFGDSFLGARIDYVIEQEPLGTGGGFLLAAERLQKTFLLLNGDTFFEVDLESLKRFHVERDAEWSFSLFRTSEIGRYMGMEVLDDGRVFSLQSGTAKPGRLANGGVYLVEPSVLKQFHHQIGKKLSLEDDLLPVMLEKKVRLYGVEQAGRFIDIGIPDDYFRASEMLS